MSNNPNEDISISVSLSISEKQRKENGSHIESSPFDLEKYTKKIAKANRRNEIGDFIIGEKIGEGTFSKVCQGVHKITNEKVAIKIMSKEQSKDPSDKSRIEKEIRIQKRLRHVSIIQQYCVIETKSTINIVTEYCSGGELFDYIVTNRKLYENEACRIFQQLIAGLEYLHKQRIVHRDLKPENLLFNSKRELKIADFGLSTEYNSKLSTPCGSPCYAAPEMVVGKKYNGSAVDIWSSGIVLYTMVCGFLPFEDANQTLLFSKIAKGIFSLPTFLSPPCRDLLKNILNTDPQKRYTFDQIKHHPWFLAINNIMDRNIIFNSPGLFISEDVVPIDEQIVKEMVTVYHYDIKTIIDAILRNKHNEITTTYYLSLKKKIRNGQKSVSDISSNSEAFLNYLKMNISKLAYFSHNFNTIAAYYFAKIRYVYIDKKRDLFEEEKNRDNNINSIDSANFNNSISITNSNMHEDTCNGGDIATYEPMQSLKNKTKEIKDNFKEQKSDNANTFINRPYVQNKGDMIQTEGAIDNDNNNNNRLNGLHNQTQHSILNSSIVPTEPVAYTLKKVYKNLNANKNATPEHNIKHKKKIIHQHHHKSVDDKDINTNSNSNNNTNTNTNTNKDNPKIKKEKVISDGNAITETKFHKVSNDKLKGTSSCKEEHIFKTKFQKEASLKKQAMKHLRKKIRQECTDSDATDRTNSILTTTINNNNHNTSNSNNNHHEISLIYKKQISLKHPASNFNNSITDNGDLTKTTIIDQSSLKSSRKKFLNTSVILSKDPEKEKGRERSISPILCSKDDYLKSNNFKENKEKRMRNKNALSNHHKQTHYSQDQSLKKIIEVTCAKNKGNSFIGSSKINTNNTNHTHQISSTSRNNTMNKSINKKMKSIELKKKNTTGRINNTPKKLITATSISSSIATSTNTNNKQNTIKSTSIEGKQQQRYASQPKQVFKDKDKDKDIIHSTQPNANKTSISINCNKVIDYIRDSLTSIGIKPIKLTKSTHHELINVECKYITKIQIFHFILDIDKISDPKENWVLTSKLLKGNSWAFKPILDKIKLKVLVL